MTPERLMLPPMEASKAPDAIGMRTASAASPEIV